MLNNKGQSLLEVIIAMAIFGMIAATMVSLAVGGFSSLEQGGEQTEAVALVQQGIESVRAIRDSAWNKLIYTTSSVAVVTGTWAFSGEGTTQTIDQYTRVISFENVCRDAGNSIVNCPGNYTDLQTKKINVVVSWQPRIGVVNTVRQTSYLTNWNSREWTQTDWSAGSGQSIWSNLARYNSDNGNINFTSAGEIKLKTFDSSSSTISWAFTTSSDYTYNAAKILVAGSAASLVDQGGGGLCSGSATACGAFSATGTCQAQAGCLWGGGAGSSTVNPSFTTNTTGWTYADWETANKVSGDRQASGGNPNGYIRVVVAGQKNNTISGYWRQSFTTTAGSPSGTVSFNWRVPSYVSTGLISYYLYVFVENTSGAPTLANYVWRSPLITGTTNWAAVSNIDISSKLGAAGTYYLKVVARGIYNNTNGPGTTIGAFDNVLLNWTKNNTCSGSPSACNTFASQSNCQAQGGCAWTGSALYPTDNPTINPITAYSGGVIVWSSFSETSTKNGGEIYYQLATSTTSTWRYWNGSSWAAAGAANYNTSSVVNANISSFSTSTGKIIFKAFLSSNGSQQVILDNVSIGFTSSSGNGYVLSGSVSSSYFNTGKTSPVQLIFWDQDISACPLTCSVKFQLRSAPDVAGSPGIWTNWYGATGAGTYFTNNSGTLVPLGLNGNQWVQYQAMLVGDGTATPILQEVRINYK